MKDEEYFFTKFEIIMWERLYDELICNFLIDTEYVFGWQKFGHYINIIYCKCYKSFRYNILPTLLTAPSIGSQFSILVNHYIDKRIIWYKVSPIYFGPTR